MKIIDGVTVKKLAVMPDDRGRLMEILRRDDEMFEKFGQVYVTTAYPGVVKAWHAHERQNDNITTVSGVAKIVLADLREDSPTAGQVNEFFAGEHNPTLVHVPALVYHGFACVGQRECVIVNVPTNVYDHEEPDELRLPFDTERIAYSWERKNR